MNMYTCAGAHKSPFLKASNPLPAHRLQGSQAYARALAKAGVLTEDEAATIVGGLDTVAEEWETGVFKVRPAPFLLRACILPRCTPCSQYSEVRGFVCACAWSRCRCCTHCPSGC